MTIEDLVLSILSASAGVTALAPASRIKPPGNWQNLTRPYIVHFPVAPDISQTYDGQVPLQGCTYQVSCFADLYSQSRALAKAVVAALSGLHTVGSPVTDGVQFTYTGSRPMPYESDVNVQQFVVEFDVHEALT